jgi:4-amino-4-deoxy-L-arabinose transferase-like glycosyltransferase
MAIAYQLIGVNEWAVRLPSALAAIALVIFGFFTLRYYGFATLPLRKNTPENLSQRQLWFSAWIGAALIGFNLETIIWARTGVSDMLLSGCIGTALFSFFWGYSSNSKEKKRKTGLFSLPNFWYLIFYIFLALAVLTKGPVGIVLPGLIIFSFLLYTGNFSSVLSEIGIIWGLLLFLAITLPWYILVTLANGEAYIDSFFGYHNLQRFTDVVNGHDAPWYFYFLIVLSLFAPWSVYLPYAIARLRWWQPSFWRKQPRSLQLGLFAFFWFVGVFLFFSISVTKLPSYVLPLMPAASILVALIWSEELSNQQPFRVNYGLAISIVANLLLAIILAVAFIYSPNLIGKDPSVQDMDDLLAASGLPWHGGIIWGLIAGAIALLLTKRRQWRWLILVNLIGFIAFIGFVLIPTTFFVDQTRQLPLRQLSETIVQVQKPEEELWMIDFKKPSLVFYTHRSVRFFKHQEHVDAYFQESGDKQPKYPTILILGREKHIKRLDIKPQDYQILDTQGVYQLIRVSTQAIFPDS